MFLACSLADLLRILRSEHSMKNLNGEKYKHANMASFRCIATAACCLFLIASLMGCKPSASRSAQIDEEHEHFPKHWPEDILRASERISELLEGSETEGKTLAVSAELADLFGWLPILAADSDLGREDFARIDAWSAAWTDRLREHARGSSGLGGLSNIEVLKQIAADLAAICNAEQQRQDELDRRFSQ
jgi:hypothetical protein